MEGPYINKTNVDGEGNLSNWMPASPMKMTCERGNCKNNNGKDYIRKDADKEGDDWDDEPIFLCVDHSVGYILYSEN